MMYQQLNLVKVFANV